MADSSVSVQAPQAPQTVKVAERDYLEQDPPIRGQRYACVSFVSPEEVLAHKESFAFRRFVAAAAQDLDCMLTSLSQRFGDDPEAQQLLGMVRERHGYLFSGAELQAEYDVFRRMHAERIDADFDAENSFRTSVRGFKVRGVYGDLAEASERAKRLQQLDPKFHIFIAEVGCWCPWSPDPDAIKDSEYAETQLNTLMKKYQENQAERDAFYAARKAQMVERLGSERDEWLRRRGEGSGAQE